MLTVDPSRIYVAQLATMSALEDVREIFGYFEEVWRHWKCNCKTAAINKFETSEEDRG